MLKQVVNNKVKLRKMPYTCEEFFNLIWGKVRTKNPEFNVFLESAYPRSSSLYGATLMLERKDFGCILTPGGSEGVWLYIGYGNEQIATLKTLEEGPGTLAKMAAIFGAFVEEAENFIQENYLDFDWNQKDEYFILVRIYKNDGHSRCGRYFYDWDEAEKYAISKNGKKGEQVIVLDLKERVTYEVA